MSVVNLSKNRLAMNIVLYALGADEDNASKIDKMEVIESENNDLLKDVKLIVGGVELDFENVVKRIGEQFDVAVQDKVTEVLNGKIGDMMNELNDMQQYIEEHKELFSPDWVDK